MKPKIRTVRGLHLLRHGGWRWTVTREVLEFAEADQLPGTEPPAGARVVREAPGRTVYFTALPDGREVVVKVFREVTFGDRLRRLFASRGRTEWDLLGRVVHRGVPVPRRLAIAECGAESVVVLEALRGHETLTEAMERYEGVSPMKRVRLAEGVAELLLRMHRGGLQHRDLHPGNIMSPTAEGEKIGQEFYILDFHHARLQRKLRDEERFQDLVDLDLYFAWHGSRSDRVRCGRRYVSSMLAERLAQEPREARAQVGAVLRQLGHTTLVRSREFWLKSDGRAHGGNRMFEAFDLGAEGSGVMRSGHGWVQRVLDSVEERLRSSDARILKHDSHATSALLPLGDLEGEWDVAPPAWVFLKRYERVGLEENVKIFFRGTRGGRAFRAGWALEVRGVRSPKVIAHHDREDGSSVLITEGFPDAANLADRLGQGAGGPPEDAAADAAAVEAGREWRADVLRHAGQILKRMHVTGLSHRDLKATNLLVHEEDGQRRVSIVDLDGLVIHPGEVPWQRRARDIARLVDDGEDRGGIRGLEERRRFLGVYLSHCLEERWREDVLARLIQRALDRRHARRRGRSRGSKK